MTDVLATHIPGGAAVGGNQTPAPAAPAAVPGPETPTGPPAAPTPLSLIAASKAPVDAKTAVALASSGDAGAILDNGRAVAKFAKSATTARTVQSLPDADQQAIVAHLTSYPEGQEEHSQMVAAGYHGTVPLDEIQQAPPAPGGFLHSLVHTLDDVRHEGATAADVTGHTVKGAAGTALHAISVPQTEVLHTYRMMDLLANEVIPSAHATSALSWSEITDNLNPRMWAHTLDPGNWERAWRETNNGATTYDPATVQALQKQLGNGRYKLLEAVSNGGDPAQLVGTYSAALQPAAKAFIQSSTFQQGLRDLNAARYSPGRDLVGSAALSQTGEEGVLAHIDAGAADGLFDWFADPTVLGSKVAEAQKVARYGLDANDVMTLYRGDNNVRRAADDVAATVNRGGAAELVKRWPALAPLNVDLTAIHADKIARGEQFTGADVARYLSAETGQIAIRSGRAGLYYHGEQLAPHMSVLGQAVKAGQANLRRAIDFTGDEGLDQVVAKIAPGYGRAAARAAAAIPQMTGSMLRRATQFFPHESIVDFASPDSTKIVLDTASTVLPVLQARKVANAWARATAMRDVGKQYELTRGLISEMFHVAGVSDSVPGSKYLADLLDATDEENRTKRFMATADDTLPNSNGVGRHAAAVIEPEMADRVQLPDPRELMRLARYNGVMGEAVKGPGIDFLDNQMRIWKLGLLARFGFAFRAGGEELANAMARLGPGILLRSAGARTATFAEVHAHPLIRMFGSTAARLVESQEKAKAVAVGARWSERDHISYQPLRDISDVLTADWPEALRKSIRTPEDFLAAVVGFPRRVTQIAGRSIAGSEMMDAWQALARNRGLDGAFEHLVSGLHHNGAGYGTDVRDKLTWARQGFSSAPVDLRASGEFKAIASDRAELTNQHTGETVFHQVWAKRLAFVRESDLAHTALKALVENAGNPEGTIVAAQRRAVLRYLRSPEAEDTIRRAERGHMLSDGRRVGVGGTTRDDALQEWSRKVVEYVNELVRTPSGRLIRTRGKTLAQHVLAGKVTPRELAMIRKDHLPNFVVGEEAIPVHQNALDRILGGAMETLVGRPMDWMSRQPIFGANYALARRDAINHLGSKLSGMSPEDADKLVHDIAHERAIRETIPYIHDVRSRTMFEHATRHFAPFLFAQRQFWARWGKVAVQSPQAFRRAQQIMNGLRVTGFVRRDPSSGQDYFVYPGSSALIHALSIPLQKLGIESYVPVPTAFTGEIRYLTPGLTGVTPDIGPAVVMPLEGLMTLAPVVAPQIQRALTDAGVTDIQTGAGIATELPLVNATFVQRILGAAYDSKTDSGQVASAMIQAANYLQASGHGLTEDSSTNDVNVYTARLKSWATSMLVMRAIFGFFAPSSPTLSVDGLHLESKLQTLLAHEPYDQAIADFVRMYPDGVPYTVGQTASPSGAELPSTNAGLNYLDQHLGFLKQFPNAAPWLIPSSVGQGPFSQAAYDEQLLTGLRVRRTIPEWFAEVLYKTDAVEYFDSENAYEKAVNAPNANYQAIETAWGQWKTAYLKTHPALRDQLANGTPGTITPDQRRSAVMSEMQKAIDTKDLPQSSTTTAISGLMAGWDAYLNGTASAPGANELSSISADKESLWQLTNNFTNWATQYVTAHPEAKAFWAGVMQYQVRW